VVQALIHINSAGPIAFTIFGQKDTGPTFGPSERREGRMLTPPGAPWGGVAIFWRRWGRRATDLPTPDSRFDQDDAVTADQTRDDACPQGRVGLLVRRMRALHLDPDRFAAGEGSAFAELKRLCAQCASRGQCEHALEDEFADPGWQAWRDYCPNSTTLSLLTALHECEGVSVFERSFR
jgi:hypothetical protein